MTRLPPESPPKEIRKRRLEGLKYAVEEDRVDTKEDFFQKLDSLLLPLSQSEEESPGDKAYKNAYTAIKAEISRLRGELEQLAAEEIADEGTKEEQGQKKAKKKWNSWAECGMVLCMAQETRKPLRRQC